MKIERPEELLIEELKDLYDAEKQLVKALPKMSKAASDSELSEALSNHLEETRQQVSRLEEAFEILGSRARSKPCKGMRGLVEEGAEVMQEDAAEALADAAMIGAGQKVETYEISGYESAKSLAQAVGNRQVSDLLDQTLREERQMNKQLGDISKRLLKETRRGGRTENEQEEGRTARSATSRRGNSRSGRATGSRTGSSRRGGRSTESNLTTDHDFIRRWAEERGAKPACVRGTGSRGDIGMLRLDFPGYSGGRSLQPISWEDFFEKFEERKLALLYQDETARGQKSNFNKLVKRETAQGAA